MVQSNRADLERLKPVESHSSVSTDTSTLAVSARLDGVLVPFTATVLMVGEARHGTQGERSLYDR